MVYDDHSDDCQSEDKILLLMLMDHNMREIVICIKIYKETHFVI